MPSYYYPTGDLATGGWTTTPAWSKIDDDPTDAGSESDSVISDDNTTPDGLRCSLNTVTDPGTDSGWVIRARIRKEAAGGHSIGYHLGLYENGSNLTTVQIGSFTNTSYTSVSVSLLSGVSLITDFSQLELYIARTGETGGSPGSRRYLECCALRLEVPDPVGGGGGSLQLGSMIRKAAKVFFPAELILPPPKPKLITVLG